MAELSQIQHGEDRRIDAVPRCLAALSYTKFRAPELQQRALRRNRCKTQYVRRHKRVTAEFLMARRLYVRHDGRVIADSARRKDSLMRRDRSRTRYVRRRGRAIADFPMVWLRQRKTSDFRCAVFAKASSCTRIAMIA